MKILWCGLPTKLVFRWMLHFMDLFSFLSFTISLHTWFGCFQTHAKWLRSFHSYNSSCQVMSSWFKMWRKTSFTYTHRCHQTFYSSNWFNLGTTQNSTCQTTWNRSALTNSLKNVAQLKRYTTWRTFWSLEALCWSSLFFCRLLSLNVANLFVIAAVSRNLSCTCATKQFGILWLGSW